LDMEFQRCTCEFNYTVNISDKNESSVTIEVLTNQNFNESLYN
jgi:hypothetical protein